MIPRKPGDRPGTTPKGAPRPGGSAAARPGAAPPEPVATAEAELDHLAASIDRFKLEGEKFFNGATPTPPEDLRVKVGRELRALRQRTLKSAAEEFRLGSLEARFNSLTELHGRRLREREEGRGLHHRPVVAPAKRYDAEAGIVLDHDLEAPAVAALLAGLARGGGTAPDLESFRGYLARQLDAIREKTGATEVQFRARPGRGQDEAQGEPVGGRALRRAAPARACDRKEADVSKTSLALAAAAALAVVAAAAATTPAKPYNLERAIAAQRTVVAERPDDADAVQRPRQPARPGARLRRRRRRLRALARARSGQRQHPLQPRAAAREAGRAAGRLPRPQARGRARPAARPGPTTRSARSTRPGASTRSPSAPTRVPSGSSRAWPTRAPTRTCSTTRWRRAPCCAPTSAPARTCNRRAPTRSRPASRP